MNLTGCNKSLVSASLSGHVHHQPHHFNSMNEEEEEEEITKSKSKIK
jgi:hypothetical protein